MKINLGEFNRWRLLLISMTVLSLTVLFAYPNLWRLVIGPFHFGAHTNCYPFLDMHGRLSAFEAHREGLDILHNPNPYDPMKRVNIKPTWPLALSFLGLGREHLLIAGFSTVAVFLSIILAIIRPERWYEALLMIVLCLSPPVFLGIERANDDLIYLSLLALIPLLLTMKSPLRYWLVWLVIFLLAPAKYYPGAVFLVFLLEVKNWRLLGALLGTGAAFLLVYVITNMEEILYLRHAVPKPTLLMIHGAGITFSSMGLPSMFGKLYSVGLVVLGTWILFRRQWLELELSDSVKRWYLIGFSVAIFCFVLNSNHDYRFVFNLLMFPLLLAMSRMRKSIGNWAIMATVMMIVLIPVFWLDIIGYLRLKLGADGTLTLQDLGGMTPIKNVIYCLFMLGCNAIAATIIRPNVRHLVDSFVRYLRPAKSIVSHDS